MLKKLCTLFISAGLIFGLTACSKTETKGNDTDTKDNNVEETSVDIKTVDDFQESQGLIKYFTIEDKNFSIPETVGEYANYLSQLGTVTLNDTGNSVEDEEIDANGISSMVAYLNVETSDGQSQRFPVRYENDTDKKIPVAEARVTQIEVKYDSLSTFDYEKVFETVKMEAKRYDVEVIGSEFIGLVNLDCLKDIAAYYLKKNSRDEVDLTLEEIVDVVSEKLLLHGFNSEKVIETYVK